MKTLSYCLNQCLILVLTFALMSGCVIVRPATTSRGVPVVTPETHFRNGMKYWDLNQYSKARDEFNLAKSLDLKFAPAISGLALIAAKNAKNEQNASNINDEGFNEALGLADEAQKLNAKIPEVFIVKAMVIAMQFEGVENDGKWIGVVENEFNQAILINPNNPEIYYRRGNCYKKAYKFLESAADFKKVVEFGKKFKGVAEEQLQLIEKIKQAAPQTDAGKKIALIKKVTRADIAALFVSELQIDKLTKKTKAVSKNTELKTTGDSLKIKVDTSVKSVPEATDEIVVAEVTDLEDHWAKDFILDIVKLNISGLKPHPNHDFYPKNPVNRGEYALMVEGVIIFITGNVSLATKYDGAVRSRFPDVNPTHPCYNAICTAINKKVMSTEMGGIFGPESSVSGVDALLAVRKIQQLIKAD